MSMRRQRRYSVQNGNGTNTSEVTQAAPTMGEKYLLKSQTITGQSRKLISLNNVRADFGGTMDPALGGVKIDLWVKVVGVHSEPVHCATFTRPAGSAIYTMCGATATESKEVFINRTDGDPLKLPLLFPENTGVTIEYYMSWDRTDMDSGTVSTLCIALVNNNRDFLSMRLHGGT